MQLSLQDSVERARCSLEGLSVGDAFGETFFIHPDLVDGLIAERALATRTWNYTDDTMMAMSIFSVLRRQGNIDQAKLARSFAERYEATRGYGPAMHRLLREIKCGEDWAERAQSLFAGQGSFGNGAAMRVGPLGAFFADDLDAVVEQAIRSAAITHTHDEAIAGAIAVAVAAAQACGLRRSGLRPGLATTWNSSWARAYRALSRSRNSNARVVFSVTLETGIGMGSIVGGLSSRVS